LSELPDTPAARYARQFHGFTVCRTLQLPAMPGNSMISRFAGHSNCPQCPEIPWFHGLPDTPVLRNARQFHGFTVCRTLRLPAMPGNSMISCFAGHSGCPQCPAIPWFYGLPDTPGARNARQSHGFTDCRTLRLPAMPGNPMVLRIAGHFSFQQKNRTIIHSYDLNHELACSSSITALC